MKIVFIVLLISFVLTCVTDEPVWCDATLYLTVVNQRDKIVCLDYQLNSNTYTWKDSLNIIEKAKEAKEEINLKLRKIQIDPNYQINDTISYRFYQGDGPCARSGGTAKYLKIFLHENSETNFLYDIYPWNPKIYHEDICDGCENINYDTIVLK